MLLLFKMICRNALFFQFINLIIFIIIECFKSIYNFFIQFFNPKYKSVKDEVVLITGAGSGIGRLLCLSFANQDSIVIGVDVDYDGLMKTKELVSKFASKDIEIKVCDVRFKSNIANLKRELDKMDLHVDILINNAGIVHGKRILELTDVEIKETFDVNLLSNFYTIQEFLPWMLFNGKGHIVFVSSIASYIPSARLSDYCASKVGSAMLAETLRCELEHVYRARDIHVTLVTPFIVKTAMFNNCKSRLSWLLPELEPDYVANKILEAVMKNQKHLAVSRIMYLLAFVKTVLPVNAMMALYKFSGGIGFLDHFQGDKSQHRQQLYQEVN